MGDLKNEFPNAINYATKFAFNHKILEEYSAIQYAGFRVPCIYGFAAICKITDKIDFCLLSRKDVRRPGRRFLVRGLDQDGHAANFAETEQILTYTKQPGTSLVAAHLQIRGSIPLKWSMKPNMAWSPPVYVDSNFEISQNRAQLHFKETLAEYSPQYCVNLIDKKGS